jgi:hypothetical protein
MEKQPGMESNFGLLLCPKSIKNGKYYLFSKFFESDFLKNFEKIKFRNFLKFFSSSNVMGEEECSKTYRIRISL